MASHKQSLIKYLLENYFETESQVKQAVKLGIVSVNNKTVKRPGIDIKPDTDNITLIGNSKLYVSRGGYKLQKAIKAFDLDIRNKICLDVGSSTGGFTDCMLDYGAGLVYAVDTGYGQLDWGLRCNKKVKCFERTNMRYLLPDKLYTREALEKKEFINFVGVGVSFISVITLLPSIKQLTAGPNNTDIAVLIKPQFEAPKGMVGGGGVIRNPSMHFDIILHFIENCYKAGLDLMQLTHSPILGNAGNLEFLAHLTWPPNGRKLNPNLENWIQKTIDIAYQEFDL